MLRMPFTTLTQALRVSTSFGIRGALREKLLSAILYRM